MPARVEIASKHSSNEAANTTRAPIEIFRTTRESTRGVKIHETTLRALDVRVHREFDSGLPLEKRLKKPH